MMAPRATTELAREQGRAKMVSIHSLTRHKRDEGVATGRIFICYRRGDSQAAAGRLYDQLLQHFNRDQLFMDVDAIEPGVDFVKSLDEQVANCTAFIAVIGPGWLTARSNNRKLRLHNPSDYVRVEIESALKRDVRVIPVLVDGASMPRSSDLPPSLQELARRNAKEIAHHRFAADCDDLARHIKCAIEVVITPSVPTRLVANYSVSQREAGAILSWPQILFSFKGRISRLQYLIGVIFVAAMVVAFSGAINVTVDLILQGEAAQSETVTKSELLKERLGAIILAISLLWPELALISKRLHDLELGWKVFLVIVVFDVAGVVFDLLDQTVNSNSINIFGLGLMFMLALVKGTEGPNKYGPDPLGIKPSTR
jgi:uncharacterized membrane protein YhaH (DUF805 family)